MIDHGLDNEAEEDKEPLESRPKLYFYQLSNDTLHRISCSMMMHVLFVSLCALLPTAAVFPASPQCARLRSRSFASITLSIPLTTAFFVNRLVMR